MKDDTKYIIMYRLITEFFSGSFYFNKDRIETKYLTVSPFSATLLSKEEADTMVKEHGSRCKELLSSFRPSGTLVYLAPDYDLYILCIDTAINLITEMNIGIKDTKDIQNILSSIDYCITMMPVKSCYGIFTELDSAAEPIINDLKTRCWF